MFVDQRACDQQHRAEINCSEFRDNAEPDERNQQQQVEQLREPKTARDSHSYDQRANSLAPVEFKILGRINQIEAGDPADDSDRQNKRRKIDISSLSDPRADRRDSEPQPKKKVGRSSETFGQRIKENDRERERREHKREPIDRTGSGEKSGRTDDQGEEHNRFRQERP